MAGIKFLSLVSSFNNKYQIVMRLTFAAFLMTAAFAGCQGNNNNAQPPTTTNSTKTKTDTVPTTKDQTANNNLTDAEKKDGWVLLFDGASKANFHVFNNKSDGSAWQLTDGLLHLDTTNKSNGKITGGG